MSNSKFIQITSYALLEYEYTGQVIPTSDVNFNRLINAKNGDIQLLNLNRDIDLTGNVADKSAAYYSPNIWAFMDIDTPTPIQNLDSDYTYENLSGVINAANIKYDTIKVHILSGYNLNDIQGLLLSIQTLDNTDKPITLANNVYLKSDSSINFNNKPIAISDRVYDRYIEVKIPSISWINTNFYASPIPGSLGYEFTNSNTGFKLTTLIDVTLYEIDETTNTNGNLFLRTDAKYSTSFTQQDEFALLSLHLSESSDGDYYEFYPTWDGAFLEEFVAERLQLGQEWAIFHQIDVYEQIGVSEIKTMSFTSFQENNFDKAQLFRPIILNADTAYSFSIEYIMRLYDKLSGEQIIREGSVSSTDTKKYGKQIGRININDGFRPYKIVNKIEEGTKFSLPTVNKSYSNDKGYKPIYYQLNNIGLQVGTTFPVVDSSTFVETEIVFGQGDAIIFISKFGSILKFVLHKFDQITKEPIELDLTGPIEYFLCFISSNGNKIYIGDDENAADMTSGELVFDIDSSQAEEIISKTDNTFYIISKDGYGKENTIYSGKIYDDSQRSVYKSQIESLKTSTLNGILERIRKEG